MSQVLLDAHTLIWASDEPKKISAIAMSVMSDPECGRFVSAATIWEIAIKVEKGKLTLSLPFPQWIRRASVDLNLGLFPILPDHAARQIELPRHHNDPFDRILAAQSLVEGMPVVSVDAVLDAYGVVRIW